MGLFEQLKEDVRAADAQTAVERLGADDRYWKPFSYAFHLYTGQETLVFPLVLNPTSIRQVATFSAELVPAQEGGVIAEENGIIMSDLTISGTTAMRPRLNPHDGGFPLPLSGQAHFLYLRDKCFGAYDALKKDPKTAPKVYMTYHNYKDSEHWVCVPRSVTLDRSLAKNFQYPYTINVTLIEQLTNPPKEPSEDSPVFTAMKDALTNIVRGLATVEAVLTDVDGVLDEIEGAVGGFVTDVLADTASVVGYVNDFVTGRSNFIRLPVETMRNLSVLVGTLISATDPNKALSLPYEVTASFLELQDGVIKLMSYPERFREDHNAAGQRFLALVQGPSAAAASDVDAAEASTITQASSMASSGLRPGDGQRIRAGVFDLPVGLPRYTGFREVVILFRDTLASLAARELDDARRWIDIALANNLTAPYISEEGLPGTLQPGQTILIPTVDAPQSADQVRSPGNPVEGSSQLDALFGTDLKITPGTDGQYDFVVDQTSMTDFVVVIGVDNVQQAVSTILNITKGSYLLHLNVGLERVVARPGTVERIIEARSRVVEAIQRDPRVRRAKNANFRLALDALEIDVDVETIDTSAVRVIGRVIS